MVNLPGKVGKHQLLRRPLKGLKIGFYMGQIQSKETIERLIAYWQIHRQFDANISDLAKYSRVSRDTVYRWLNRKALPKEQKSKLIEEWLSKKSSQE